MAIKEQIGYPDYILEDQNDKLDQEYANVSTLCIPQYKAYSYFLATWNTYTRATVISE